MADRNSARRGSLPIPDRQHLGLIAYDAKDPNPSFPPIEPLSPPEGAPNVLVILLDHVGYGAGSVFGGTDETTDIGDDYGMPVSADYAGAIRFNGRIDVVQIDVVQIDVVQIDVGEDDQSHLIDPAEVARVAMSRQ